jgi:hypothetical protein
MARVNQPPWLHQLALLSTGWVTFLHPVTDTMVTNIGAESNLFSCWPLIFSYWSLFFQPDLALPPTYLPTYLPIYQSTFFIIYILACLHTYLLTHLPTCLPTYPPTFLPTTYAMLTSINGYNNMKVLQIKLFKITLVICKAWWQ